MQRQTVWQIEITSNAFADGGLIPEEHTCDGENRSPHLTWSEAPAGVESFALIMEDPDAPRGTFVHWVLYDLPGDRRELKANVPQTPELSKGGRQGRNSAGKIGYMGPCPPSGSHRYFFRLYALDVLPQLPAGASKEQLTAAMAGHVVGEGQIMGRYWR